MLRVEIYCNDEKIMWVAARRTHPLTSILRPVIEDDQICTYETDTGKVIQHRYGDGAAVLAQRMLDTIRPGGQEL